MKYKIRPHNTDPHMYEMLQEWKEDSYRLVAAIHVDLLCQEIVEQAEATGETEVELKVV